ncbi:mCG1045485, isoform CRA_d, partial [Mus musculus]
RSPPPQKLMIFLSRCIKALLQKNLSVCPVFVSSPARLLITDHIWCRNLGLQHSWHQGDPLETGQIQNCSRIGLWNLNKRFEN